MALIFERIDLNKIIVLLQNGDKATAIKLIDEHIKLGKPIFEKLNSIKNEMNLFMSNLESAIGDIKSHQFAAAEDNLRNCKKDIKRIEKKTIDLFRRTKWEE